LHLSQLTSALLRKWSGIRGLPVFLPFDVSIGKRDFSVRVECSLCNAAQNTSHLVNADGCVGHILTRQATFSTCGTTGRSRKYSKCLQPRGTRWVGWGIGGV